MEMRALFSPMNISAMGLVNVDLTLLPTVCIHYLFKSIVYDAMARHVNRLLCHYFFVQILGTCLTYTIVMIQFKSSEIIV